MTSIDIYNILSSKPHNPHYLKRYWKFIQWCKEQNKTLLDNVYVEEHHIAPKAKDLFPQYKSFRENPWNKIKLTSHQHILAHVMLWKIYGMSQVKALDAMLGKFSINNVDMKNRVIPLSIHIRYSSKIRDASAGMATYYDKDKNNYYLHRDDPRIKELDLLYIKCGSTHNEWSKQKMSDSKAYMKTVDMYMLNCRTKVRIYSDKFEQYLDQGWTTSLTSSDEEYTAHISKTKKQSKMKGRSRWAYPDGTFHSFIKNDDPIIKEVGLIVQITDKSRAQYVRRSAAAKEANSGSQYYNNGTEHRKFKSDPGHPWVIGPIDWDRNAQKEATSKKRKDTFVINDTKSNRYLKLGEIVPEGWVLGMAPRK